MENACDIALRMMARAAQKKQGSSVARNVFSPKLSNNLRANEKIFAQSVALNNSDTQSCLSFMNSQEGRALSFGSAACKFTHRRMKRRRAALIFLRDSLVAASRHVWERGVMHRDQPLSHLSL